MVQVVNVVASGALDVELDLETVARELDDVVDYDPEKYLVRTFGSVTMHH
jgi:transcription initiation factor TFIID TATA-box-binding protein